MDFNKFEKINKDELEMIHTDDMNHFTKKLDMIFNIGELARLSLSKLLSDTNKDFYHRSYSSYDGGKICGTVSIIECDLNNCFIFNLGIHPEVKNSSILEKMIESVCNMHQNKNIFMIEEFSDILSKKILPEIGFKLLGTHHILDITKLYDYFKKDRQ
jgi:hypothetical protein